MKRFRDGKGRTEKRSVQRPSLGKGAASGAGSIPHQSSLDEGLEGMLTDGMGSSAFDDVSEVSNASQLAFSRGSRPKGSLLDTTLRPQALGFEPSLGSRALGSSLPVAMDVEEPSLLLDAHAPQSFMSESYVHAQYPSTAPHAEHVSCACAAYFRLHPSSSCNGSVELWIATLGSHSMDELRDTAAERHPGTVCVRVEGILKDARGRELPLLIKEDQELSAYLEHLRGAAPTFCVQLVWKTP